MVQPGQLYNMERCIITKEALEYLNLNSDSATEKLAESIVITDENLHFNNFPIASVVLTHEQVSALLKAGFQVKPEEKGKLELLAGDYEKVRSRYYKAQKKDLKGRGCKVAILDTGLATSIIPVEFAVNFATGDPGVTGNPSHGTFVTSIIKDSAIGLASGATVHFLKIVDDEGNYTESGLLAALDYCIDQEIDIVNMSFGAGFLTLPAAIQDCINAGIVMCAASGNNNPDAIVIPPACLPGVISVNAIKEDGTPGASNVILPDPNPNNYHGPTVACSGIVCEGRFYNGVYGTSSGTSFSCPFFVGLFACCHEECEIMDNYTLLSHVLDKVKKDLNSVYFGRGLVTF